VLPKSEVAVKSNALNFDRVRDSNRRTMVTSTHW